MADALSSRIPLSSKCLSGSSTYCSSIWVSARFGLNCVSSIAVFVKALQREIAAPIKKKAFVSLVRRTPCSWTQQATS